MSDTETRLQPGNLESTLNADGWSSTWTTNLRWQDIPEGYYAFPVHGHDMISADDDLDTWEAPLLGHQTYRRQVSKTLKNGKVIGHDRFVKGVAWRKRDVDAELEDFQSANVWSEPVFAIVDILTWPDGANYFRGIYGQVTGCCGFCRKRLTDPKSVLIGIGPECRGFR